MYKTSSIPNHPCL